MITQVNTYGIGNYDTSVPDTMSDAFSGMAQISLTEYDTPNEPVIEAGGVFEMRGEAWNITSNEAITGWAGITIGAKCWIYFDGLEFYYSETIPVFGEGGWYNVDDRAFFSLTKNIFSSWVEKAFMYDKEFDIKIIPSTYSGKMLYSADAYQYHDICYNPVNDTIVTSGYISTTYYIREFDKNTGEVLLNFTIPNLALTIAVDPATGNFIAGTYNVKTDYLYIYSPAGVYLSQVYYAGANLAKIGINEDGNIIWSSYSPGIVHICNGISLTPVSSYPIFMDAIRTWGYDPTRRWFMSENGSQDYNIVIQDEDGNDVYEMTLLWQPDLKYYCYDWVNDNWYGTWYDGNIYRFSNLVVGGGE